MKLFEDGPPAAPLSDSHKCKEDAEADRSEDKLVHGHALQGREGAVGLSDGEGAGEEAEPFELNRGHEEAVGHEAGEAFKVEGGRAIDGSGDKRAQGGGFLFQVCELDRYQGAVVWGTRLVGGRQGFSPGLDGGQGLGNRVSYAA